MYYYEDYMAHSWPSKPPTLHGIYGSFMVIKRPTLHRITDDALTSSATNTNTQKHGNFVYI